jgi:hypothetical protein
MRRKPAERARNRNPATRDTDTSSYEQLHGTPDPRFAPNRRNEKMPHERDESARGTGNRLDENPTPSERQISEAHRDVEQGRVDTDRRGVPDDVPGSERNRES